MKARFEQKTVGAVVVSLTTTTFNPYLTADKAQAAFITCANGPIRCRFDGENPTATVGHLLYDKETLELKSYTEIQNFRAIKSASTDGILSVTYR